MALKVQAAVAAAEELERGTDDGAADELERGTEDGATDEATGVDEGALLELERLDDTAVPQAAPVTVGVSAAPAPLVPCTPNSTYCPGWIVLFQLRLLAE